MKCAEKERFQDHRLDTDRDDAKDRSDTSFSGLLCYSGSAAVSG